MYIQKANNSYLKPKLTILLLLFIFLAYNPLSANGTVYLNINAEDGTVGGDLPNPPFCQAACGETYAVGKYASIGGAPQGTKYFQWTTLDSQHSAYNLVNNPSTLPTTSIIGKTFYLAYYFNYTRINGLDIWYETSDSADKGIEITGTGVRWIASPGYWGSLGNNQDHHYTIWMGNPTYHLNSQFEGNPYWTVIPPNQNGYSLANPPQLQYERWYSAVMAVKMATDNTGFVALYIDGVKILEWTGLITAATTSATINYITMGGTIAQPAYDAPAHIRKYDAMLLTDSWQDIINGGYFKKPSSPFLHPIQ